MAGYLAVMRNLPEKQKGDVSEDLAKACLHLETEMRVSSSMVGFTTKCRKPSRRNSSCPQRIKALNLVVETNDGEFWAIQCKYRQGTDQSLTWREIPRFTGLAFGVCQGFAFGIICSTTERITIGKVKNHHEDLLLKYQKRHGKRVAEGVGFEPTVRLPVLLISSQMPLTTQPPFLLVENLHLKPDAPFQRGHIFHVSRARAS